MLIGIEKCKRICIKMYKIWITYAKENKSEPEPHHLPFPEPDTEPLQMAWIKVLILILVRYHMLFELLNQIDE
jgi:hypothetical protein